METDKAEGESVAAIMMSTASLAGLIVVLDQHLARQGRKRIESIPRQPRTQRPPGLPYLIGKGDNAFKGIFRMYIAVSYKSIPFSSILGC